jgi:methionyl-tRNA formyltransferase
MEETLDTGAVLVRVATPIAPDETAGSLHDRLAVLAARCARDTLARWDEITTEPQDERLATWAPKIGKEDGALRWDRPAAELDRRIRAMTPWPGADAPTGAGPLRIRLARPTAGTASPGTVLALDPLVVACGTGALLLVDVQAPGRRPVTGAEYARGARLHPGTPI